MTETGQGHSLTQGATGERLCWKPGAQRLQVRPVTPSLHGHWPVVWLQVLPAAPTGWQSQAEGRKAQLGVWGRRAWRHAGGRLTSAGATVTQDPARVAVEALPAVVAVATGSIVPAVEAHPATAAAGQSVQLHVEAASSGMAIAGASCREASVRGSPARSQVPRLPSEALTKAGVGLLPCSPLPWPVAVEGLAAAAIGAFCTVLAVAGQVAMGVQQAP